MKTLLSPYKKSHSTVLSLIKCKVSLCTAKWNSKVQDFVPDIKCLRVVAAYRSWPGVLNFGIYVPLGNFHRNDKNISATGFSAFWILHWRWPGGRTANSAHSGVAIIYFQSWAPWRVTWIVRGILLAKFWW